jgi:hypothetical protein
MALSTPVLSYVRSAPGADVHTSTGTLWLHISIN